MTRFHIRLTLGTIAVLSCVGMGCFSTPPQEHYQYYLTLPMRPAIKEGGPRLAVADFGVAAGYETDKIAFRDTENELRYYGYRKWVTEPQKMLAAAFLRHLESSNHFSRVDYEDRMRTADAVVDARINAIEEIDGSDEEKAKARLSMVIVVREIDTDRVLVRYVFDETRPCATRHPRSVAKAISEIVSSHAKKLAPKITASLKLKPE